MSPVATSAIRRQSRKLPVSWLRRDTRGGRKPSDPHQLIGSFLPNISFSTDLSANKDKVIRIYIKTPR